MDNETVRKRLVNSNLLRIKAEMSDSVTCDDFDEDFDEFGETYDEIGSQPPRQQQVYQYLDMCLHGLTRDRYIQPNDTMAAIEFDENEHGDFVKPDMYALMFKMISDITEVYIQQASDSFTSQQIQQHVTKMAVHLRTFQGTLNSILARVPVHNTTPQVTKLQSVNNQISNTNNANETLPSVPTYAEVMTSPVSTRDNAEIESRWTQSHAT